MKISYLLPGFGGSGGLVVAYNLMDHLSRRGHQVYAVTPGEAVEWKPGMASTVLDRFANVSLPARAQHFMRRVSDRIRNHTREFTGADTPAQLAAASQSLCEQWVESDVTIATYWATAFAAYALSDRTAAIYHMQHNEELFYSSSTWKKFVRLTYDLPLYRIANCSWLADQMEERYRTKVQVLHPAIDHGIFRPTVGPERYGAAGPTLILSYADARPFKGWDDAVETMRLIRQELGDSVVWKVFGDLQPEPSTGAVSVGRVHQPQLARLYAESHVVFVPSWYESFPLQPLEAMASGTAVVTTRIGTEDYAVDGVNAKVVPPRNPEILAEAIVELCRNRDESRRIAEEGRRTALRFTWEAATDQLEGYLDEAVLTRHCTPTASDLGVAVSSTPASSAQ